MHEREEKYITKKSIRMNVKPEFAQLFRWSQTTSSIAKNYNNLENPGKFYHHVKSAKDRRKNKIDAKNNEDMMERERSMNEFKDKKIQILEEKLDALDELKKEHKKYSDKLDKLYQNGLIDLNGDLLSDYEIHNDQDKEERKSQNSDM